ncbi:hypothetical protein [Kitasatospora sp. NPDC051164]
MAAVTAACAAVLVLRPTLALTERTFTTSAPTEPADRTKATEQAEPAGRDAANSGPAAQR